MRRDFWINYGVCPTCGLRNEMRVGPVTCKSCATTFDAKGMPIKAGLLRQVAVVGIVLFVVYILFKGVGG